MSNPYNYTIEELEAFIAKLPRVSSCNRQDVRMYEALLTTRKQQQQQMLQEKRLEIPSVLTNHG